MASSLTDMRLRLRYRLKDLDPANYTWDTDNEVDKAVNDAVAALWPEIYKRTVETMGTTAADTKAYNLPSGCERVGKIEVEGPGGEYLEVMNWEEDTENVQAVFPKNPLATGRTIRVTHRGKFLAFVSGTPAQTSDYPDYCDESIITKAAGICLKKLRSERAKFTQYSANLDKEAVTMEDLIKLIEKCDDEFNAFLDANRMPPIESQRMRRRGMTEGVQPAHSGRSRTDIARTGGET